jgi:uncharacterized surface protein with fasciclin (FAS1) repeats
MSKSRLYLAGIIGTAVVTFGSFQLAHAYSNDAAPAPAATTTTDASAAPVAAPTAMDPTKTIFENISNAADFSTLADALKATGLDATLSASGPKVLFAPNNAAFAKLPPEQLEDLKKPENKAKFAKILNYHVVTGKLTEHDIESLSGATRELALKTMEGSDISLKQGDNGWTVTDESGGQSVITTDQDIPQSNGSIYTIDTVLMPKM